MRSASIQGGIEEPVRDSSTKSPPPLSPMTHHQKDYTGRSISLPDDMDKELVAAAETDGVSVSMLVRRWIKWQLQARHLNNVDRSNTLQVLDNKPSP